MEFNSLLFRKPQPSYSSKDLNGDVIFIPKIIDENFETFNAWDLAFKIKALSQNESKGNITASRFHKISIPCLLIPSFIGSSKLLLYFHANAEDIGCTSNFLGKIMENLGVHIISVEYPGYGMYPGTPGEKEIISDAETVINFLIKFGKWKEENIIVFGRSVGSGPAIHLASRYSISCLILMSAFTSLQDVVKSHVGFLKSIVKERFKNIDKISGVKCPIFILHGKNDNIVPLEHSYILQKNCKAYSKLIIPENMDHNQFDFLNDFIIPFANFCDEINLNFKGDEILYLPLSCFFEPQLK